MRDETWRRRNFVIHEGLSEFFRAMRLILEGAFIEAQKALFHSAWTPTDVSRLA